MTKALTDFAFEKDRKVVTRWYDLNMTLKLTFCGTLKILCLLELGVKIFFLEILSDQPKDMWEVQTLRFGPRMKAFLF